MENTKYGRRRGGRWISIRAKAQDTRANPNSWKTHLVRKRWDIGLLRALSPGFMMMVRLLKCGLGEECMEKISWTEHKTNEEVLETISEERSLIRTIKMQTKEMDRTHS